MATAPTLIAGVSSSAGFFSLINQFQMYLLLPILVYCDQNVVQFVTGMEISLFSFDFIPIKDIPIFSQAVDFLSVEQDNEYFEEIGIESKSALVSNLQLVLVMGFIVGVHLLFTPIYFHYLEGEGFWHTFRIKLMSMFTFTIYIRMLVESILMILLASVAEIYDFNISTAERRTSFGSA